MLRRFMEILRRQWELYGDKDCLEAYKLLRDMYYDHGVPRSEVLETAKELAEEIFDVPLERLVR